MRRNSGPDGDDWVSSPQEREEREARIQNEKEFENGFYSFLGVDPKNGKFVTPIAPLVNGGMGYEVCYEDGSVCGGMTYLGYKDGVIFNNPEFDTHYME